MPRGDGCRLRVRRVAGDNTRTFQSSSTLHVPAVSSSRHIFILRVVSSRHYSRNVRAWVFERYLWSRLQVARRRP